MATKKKRMCGICKRNQILDPRRPWCESCARSGELKRSREAAATDLEKLTAGWGMKHVDQEQG